MQQESRSALADWLCFVVQWSNLRWLQGFALPVEVRPGRLCQLVGEATEEGCPLCCCGLCQGIHPSTCNQGPLPLIWHSLYQFDRSTPCLDRIQTSGFQAVKRLQ